MTKRYIDLIQPAEKEPDEDPEAKSQEIIANIRKKLNGGHQDG